MKSKILIIGAGISGLTAAYYLYKNGHEVQIIEASDSSGGRIKTDFFNGFLLDHGFQVFLTEYSEAKKILNYDTLNLKPFLPGAIVLHDGGTFEIADPFRRPSALFPTIFAPVGSLLDKWKTFTLKNHLVSQSFSKLFSQSEKTTLQRLEDYGFSKKMIRLFYQPFFSGIFLENNLKTSNRMFDFVLKCFSQGNAVIPENGMHEIPKQIASHLPKNTILFNKRIEKIENGIAYDQNNTEYKADKIIIATEATSLLANYKKDANQKFQSVTNIYFETDIAPSKKPIVILNASTNKKWVNNLVVMNAVSNKYAPKGKHLISVSYNGIPSISEQDLAKNMQEEVAAWFPEAITNWKFLKAYTIKYALPNQNQVRNDLQESDFKISDNLFVCGDHLLNGSINGAMKSGRILAEYISKIV
jgi:phytoene dehydrogenase-like protein